VLARVPLSTREDVEEAIRYAVEAYEEWRETPPLTRARYMFTLKNLMEEHFEGVSKILTKEHGKSLDELRGEVRRAIECVHESPEYASRLSHQGKEVAGKKPLTHQAPTIKLKM
jgi:malonate-semialdehyde dehydrogenase (acetylating)/methylmalonate-semialdehyde dehydrogenase